MNTPEQVPQPQLDVDGLLRESRHSLSCPQCKKAMPLMGMRKVIRHPIAERLRQKSFKITGWWTMFVGLCFLLTMAVGGPGLGRFIGWGLMFLPMVPGLMIFVIVRLFPRYRVFSCPYCKFYHLEQLRGMAGKVAD